MSRDERQTAGQHFYVTLTAVESGGRRPTSVSLTNDPRHDRPNSAQKVVKRRFQPSRRPRRFMILPIQAAASEPVDARDPITPPTHDAECFEWFFDPSELLTRDEGLAEVAARNHLAGEHCRYALFELGRRAAGPAGMIQLSGQTLGLLERRYYTPLRIVTPRPSEVREQSLTRVGNRVRRAPQLCGV